MKYTFHIVDVFSSTPFGGKHGRSSALMLILEDQHEHLGRSIAHARSNGVVPPWSK